MKTKVAAPALRNDKAPPAKRKSAAPDWLPNWNQPSKYPDPAITPAQAWAWEFLRRNPEYRRECKNYVNMIDETERRLTGIEIVRKWGLHSRFLKPIDPSKNSGWWCETIWHVSASSVIEVTADWDFDSKEKSLLLLAFDLGEPIEPQLDAARSHLVGRRQMGIARGNIAASIAPRDRPGKYVDYLRALDADAGGRKAKEFGPKVLQRARELRDGGYRTLALIRAKGK